MISSEDLLISFHMDGRNLHAKVVTWRNISGSETVTARDPVIFDDPWVFGRIYLGSLYM